MCSTYSSTRLISTAFKSIIDHMELSDTYITELVIVHGWCPYDSSVPCFQHSSRSENTKSLSVGVMRTQVEVILTVTLSVLINAVSQHCLQRVLKKHGQGTDLIDRLLLSIIFHCAKDDDCARPIRTLQSTFACGVFHSSSWATAEPSCSCP